MHRKVIDRTGMECINNFGSKMIIIGYRNCNDIDIYFPEYNWTARNCRYDHFKNGDIRCPYEPRIYGYGFIGEGEYKVLENKKQTRVYNTWHNMLQRCFDEKFKERCDTYNGVTCNDEFLNFQLFGEWDYDNYYKVDDEIMCLDKDILHKGNKIYSPENCIYVPERINLLFVKRQNCRGEYPIGVNPHRNKYQARFSIYGKNNTFGTYNTPKEAFEVYKREKENYIKQIADEYKNKIPDKLYQAMYNWEVSIDD